MTSSAHCQLFSLPHFALPTQYLHRVNDKVSLATDFLWHWGAREATATVGYDAQLRQCRVRGKVDTNGARTLGWVFLVTETACSKPGG